MRSKRIFPGIFIPLRSVQSDSDLIPTTRLRSVLNASSFLLHRRQLAVNPPADSLSAHVHHIEHICLLTRWVLLTAAFGMVLT